LAGAVAAAVATAALLSAMTLRRPEAIAQPSSAAAEEVVLASFPAPLPPGAVQRLADGVAAADAGDWYAVRSLRDGAQDPLVMRILTWRLATSTDAPLDFYELRSALNDLTDWPGRATMRERAEQALSSAGLPADQAVAFLTEGGGPLTGDGRVALAEAYAELGRRDEAAALARQAWREDRLSDRSESVVLSRFSGALSQDDHAARLDALLWRGLRSDAQALFQRVSSADRLVAQARIALQTRPRRGLQAAVDAVPSSRLDDPGFLYDRARYIRRSGRPEDAAPYAARIDAAAAPVFARDDIFLERRAYLPAAYRARDGRRAYALAANHGIPSGAEFADAEFVAGWVSLRFLNNPQQALTHFERLASNVSSPISLSRGHYWRAQALAALGDAGAADLARREAAQYIYTFYGQLAAVQIDPQATIALDDPGPVPPDVRARFEQRDLVRAIRLMTQFGDEQDFERIAFYLDDVLEDPREIELLSALARENGYPRSAVRSAKAGLFRGVVAPNAAYPVVALPSGAVGPNRPDPAFVHAIIRQESEFNPLAVSSAGARGLMQLMPATARATARMEGLPYELGRLTSDPAYNMHLGSAHLQDLLDEFGGSYILTAAAYNAGGGRARQWIAEYGDPRSPSTDAVDWIEMIPFSETRNYVQRVIENLEVYRHRISGRPERIRIMEDIRRG
jgi:soluble lytic murein transglycosylase